MRRIQKMIQGPLYFILSDMGDLGLAGADPEGNIRDAANRYVDHMERGQDCVVIKVHRARAASATKDAREAARRWLLETGREIPGWLVGNGQ